MATNSYDQGDGVRLKATFKNLTGTLVDPTTITLKTVDPIGGLATYTYGGGTVSKEGTGIYYKDMDLTSVSPGWYFYRWVGTGSATAAQEGKFYIREAVT